MSPTSTPVVFVVFNRPKLTAQVLARIKTIRPSRLFVFADGPRTGCSGDVEKCAEVRRIVDTEIDWPCAVSRDYSEINLGCAKRVSSGLNAVFAQVEEAIVLEDHCLPDLTFFPFCAELLERYRNVAGVSHIGGANFQQGIQRGNASYYFSRYTHSWGWATWRRAWTQYRHHMPDWNDIPILQEMSESERSHWRYVLAETQNERIDTWDYRWQVASWRMMAHSVVPQINLITNIGFGVDGTHTTVAHEVAEIPSHAMSFPLIHPESITPDDKADEATAKLFFRAPSLRTTIKQRVNRILRRT